MRNLLKHWTDLLLGWLGVTSDTGGWDRWIAFLLVLLFVVLFDFACRLVIVRGVRRLVARTRARVGRHAVQRPGCCAAPVTF